MKAPAISLCLLASLQAACRPEAPPAPAPQPSTVSPALQHKRRLGLLPPGDAAAPGPADQKIRQIQTAIGSNPDKADLWVELGRAWVRKARETAEPGLYVNADACADVALGMEPDHAGALDLRGLVLINDHRFEEARALAEQMVAHRAFDPMAYGTLHDALLELGRYDEAAAALQRMMELKPGLPAYARASYLAWLHGDGRAAKEAMRHAIDAAPQSRRDPEPRAWALTQAALLFWHEGDYEGADAGFVMALAGFPDYAPALLGRGRAALGRGQRKEAAGFLERSFRLSPLPETAWLLGDVRRLLGDEKGAAEAHAEVVRHGRRGDPRTLALFYATHGRDTEEALRLAGEERRKRRDVYTLDAHAFVLLRAGRTEEARRTIDEAMGLGTRDARLLFHAGAIHLASGDAPGGRKLLEEALRLNPAFDVRGAAEARRLLGQDPKPAAGARR